MSGRTGGESTETDRKNKGESPDDGGEDTLDGSLDGGRVDTDDNNDITENQENKEQQDGDAIQAASVLRLGTPARVQQQQHQQNKHPVDASQATMAQDGPPMGSVVACHFGAKCKHDGKCSLALLSSGRSSVSSLIDTITLVST